MSHLLAYSSGSTRRRTYTGTRHQLPFGLGRLPSAIRSIVEDDGDSIRTLFFSAVPEPGTFAGLAIMDACGLGRRRR